MVRPIPAVGLASALVQTIDFGINTLRKDHPINQPSDTSSAPVENAAFLQDVIHNLYRLLDLIDNAELKKLHNDKSNKNAKKLSEAAQQLLKHSEQVKELITPLIDALIAAQEKGKFGDPRWPTARDALMNEVWKKSDVTGAKKKFRALRREIDTSLLLAMRQYLDQSIETGLAFFSNNEGVHWEKWQNETLDAVHSNNWKSGKKKNVEEFSKLVDRLVIAEKEAYFRDTVFELLRFEELDERVYSVGKPIDGSFEWVFGEAARQVGGLLEWFSSARGEGVFWVTGKPGAGKTTLMKHLLRNPRLFPHLEAWSGHLPGITSGFFFWNAGVELQKSPIGLLRSILYESLQDMILGPLEVNQDIIQTLFSDRWNAFLSYAGGLHDFVFPELQKAFVTLISDASKKFLFIVDGLDETEDYPKELIDLILTASKRDNVKFLLSARSSPVFQSAFETRPRLVLDEYTKPDIQTCITTTFDQAPKLETLRGKMDGQEEITITKTLTEKSSGVFLWATLATSFLLNSLEEGDDFLILKDRADALPYLLDDLIAHMLLKIPAPDLEVLWKTHTLLGSIHGSPAILPMSFAMTAETQATFVADVRPLKSTEISKRVEDMHSLLHYQCKGFISVFDTTAPGQHLQPENLRVSYTHRAIKDYLLVYPDLLGWNTATESGNWSASQQWANAHLWGLKTLAPPTKTTDAPLSIWTPISSALEVALTLFADSGRFPLTYTDAALSTAVFLHLKSEPGSDLPHFPSSTSTPSATTLTTPFDLAVLLNLTPYILLKAKIVERKDIRHAIDFSRIIRKRLGVGGEEEWLAGKGRERLRAEYGKGRAESDALLEYYAKAVKFGSKMPVVEVPEYV